MYCAQCGAPLNDEAKFCAACGAAAGGTPQAAPAKPSAPEYVPPQYIQPQTAGPHEPPAAPPPYLPVRKKRRIGWLIALAVFLVLAGTGTYFYARFAWAPPRDLGIRYTQADYDSAVKKVGLKVDFMGMDSDELTELIASNRDEEVAIDDYDWAFSKYEERSFELTPEEATAFINEIAPPFSWFEDAQMQTFSDGRSAGSYKVRFDKIKAELIPDIAGQIPSAIASLLPDTFNLYMEGYFEIRDNEVYVPDKLERLEVGDVPLQPVIGDLTGEQRASVFDYAERIYKQIPDLDIHTLKINQEGNFEISAYMPTQVVVTKK